MPLRDLAINLDHFPLLTMTEEWVRVICNSMATSRDEQSWVAHNIVVPDFIMHMRPSTAAREPTLPITAFFATRMP